MILDSNCGCTDKLLSVIGWKAWYADGKKYGGKTLADWKELPDDGMILAMLYYDKFDTTGKVRLRRVVQGNDYYWMSEGHSDNLFGQDNIIPDDKRYKNLSIKRGIWTDDLFYSNIVEQAMNDFNVSELGLTPVPSTSDV